MFNTQFKGKDIGDCKYGLSEYPTGVVEVSLNPVEDRSQFKGQLKSTFGNNPPQIGERIKVTMNSLGFGKVTAYFIEHEYVGVEVALEKQPDWHIRQRGKGGHCLVFGAEIKRMEKTT